MRNSDDTMDVLIGMREYEKNLFEIYEILSDRFKEHQNLWHDIAVDENTHALMVDTIISLYKSNEISFSDRNFDLTQIKKDLDKLNLFKDRINKHEISLSEAIKFVLLAERSLIERELFIYKDSDPPEFKKILKVLQEDTKEHYKKINELYKEISEKW